MDWELKARGLADDLRSAGFWLVGMSAWLWVEVDGLASLPPAVGVLLGFVLLAGERIKP